MSETTSERRIPGVEGGRCGVHGVAGSAIPGVAAGFPFSGLTPLNIHIPDMARVSEYLARHGEIGKHLPEICAALRQAVGSNSEISLEIYKDPEIADSYLTLYVRDKKYSRAFMEHINAISSRFDDQLSEVPGNVVITTDFLPPRVENAV